MNEPFIDYMKRELSDDVVLIACGLPASYKTETTEVISRLKGYPILRTDLIRKEVLKGEDIFDEKVASNMDKRNLVYDEMFAQAFNAAEKGKGVILDATFITQKLRLRAAEVAAKAGKTLVIQQTICPQEVSLKRILRRTKEKYESNALTEQAYLNNKNKFEAVDIKELKAAFPSLSVIHLTIDTASDDENNWRVIGRREI